MFSFVEGVDLTTVLACIILGDVSSYSTKTEHYYLHDGGIYCTAVILDCIRFRYCAPECMFTSISLEPDSFESTWSFILQMKMRKVK